MKISLFRRAADYGGVLNAVLCVVHCAAGPLLLAWWGTRHAGPLAERLELAFLVLSGVLVALATWRQSSAWLRLALWALFAVFTAAALLAERWPALQLVQYAASAGLIGAHLLNQRYCHRCVAGLSPLDAHQNTVFQCSQKALGHK
jgi:chromate transport protein ChrA